MADNPQKPMKTKESDSAREAGTERTHVRPEVAKSAQVDARGMQEVESTRTNKHSGSASELEWNRSNGDRGSGTDSGQESGKASGRGGIDGKGDKSGNSGKGKKDGGDGDSITIEAVDENGKKFTVASRVSGGTERDYLAKGEKPQERFHTGELKAIQTDQSLPAEKRALAQQLQEMRSLAKDANQPTAEIDRFASETFKDEIRNMRSSSSDEGGTFQAISDVNLAQGTLPEDARGTDLTKSASPSDAASLQAQSQARHLDEDGRPIVDHQPEQMDKKTFSLGLTYEEGTPPPQNETMEKMSRFFQAAAHRAEAFITNPDAQAKYIEEQKEKFIGIGIGLNDAKEAFKTLAGEGFKQLGHGAENLKEGASHLVDALSRPADINEAVVKETQAVLKVLAEDPNAVNKALSKGLDGATHAVQPMFDAGGKMLHDMSENPQYLNDALAKGLGIAGNAVLKASNEYSNLPPREKGRVIGLLMFDMINPEGTLEAPTLMAQTAKRGTNAAKEIVQVAASSATVQEAKANLYILEDLVKSDEFKDLLQNGVFEALNIGKQESFAALGPQFDNFNMAMMGDGFWEPVKYRWRCLNSELGRIDSRFRRYRQDLPSPFEKGLSSEQQTERAVDWLLERVPESAEHFDHYSVCRQTLLEHHEPQDLLTLCERNHMIMAEDKMEDVIPKIAEMRCPDNKELFQDNFPAVTNYDDKYTIITKRRAEILRDQGEMSVREPKRWVVNSEDSRVDGIVRHELGQILSSKYNWTNEILSDPQMKAAYFERQSVWRKAVGDVLEQQTKLQKADLTSVEYQIQDKIVSNKYDKLMKFRGHFLGNDYGLGQTVTDLYAIENGGSMYSEEFESELLKLFGELRDGLREKGWYRK